MEQGANMSEENNPPDAARLSSLKDWTQIVYLLYALTYFGYASAIIGIIINYVKLEDAAGTWLESHFRWQIRTFWFGLLWTMLGVGIIVLALGILGVQLTTSYEEATRLPISATAILAGLAGSAILFVNFFWIIYRVIKGWVKLNNDEAMHG
jgi:uncharacterized membrane protein